MSGGHYDYQYRRIEQLADDIEGEFINDGRYTGEDWSLQDFEGSTKEYDRLEDATEEERKVILKEIKDLVASLRNCSKRAKELEWLMSGDTGPTTYLGRLKDLLDNKEA